MNRRSFLRAARIGGGLVACPAWLTRELLAPRKSYFFVKQPQADLVFMVPKFRQLGMSRLVQAYVEAEVRVSLEV